MRNFAALFLFFSLATVANSSPSRCLGGDGPKPFSDISGEINFKIRAVDVPGTMQEFLVWEKKNALIYRESTGEVKGLSLKSQPGKPKEFYFSKIAQPLSQVIDSDERYLVSKGDRIWLFDSWNPNWSPLIEGIGARPLFWHNNSVYSVLEKRAAGKITFEFYSNRPGQFSKTPLCIYTQDEPASLKLAKGKSAPHVYFYSVTESDKKRNLMIAPLNVSNCRFEKATVYEGIRHPVVDVSYLADHSAIAVKLDNVKQNLLWWSAKGCNYYDVGPNGAIIPNFKQPVLVSWLNSDGLEILYPETSEKVKILEGLPITSLNSEDLWITDDLRHLYIGTHLTDEPNRYLLQMDLDTKRRPTF